MVGNDSFPIDAAIGAQVVEVLQSLGQDSTILTRKRPTFDVFIQHCAMILGLRCLTYDADGGSSNIERDSQLVADCTELHAFIDLDAYGEGRLSGTGWLIEKALSAKLPVTAYGVADGLLVKVGETEITP